jgi:hypothetical protein
MDRFFGNFSRDLAKTLTRRDAFRFTIRAMSEFALLPVRSAWWGGSAALALLVGFIAAIAINLAQGRKPDCQCFGQSQSKPIGWSTLARNGVVGALAAVTVWAGAVGQVSIIDVVAAGVPVPAAATSSGNGRGKVLPMPMTAHAGLPIGEVAHQVTLPDLKAWEEESRSS